MKGDREIGQAYPMGELPAQVLAQGLRELGLPADVHRLDALLRFVEEIERCNPRYGLVKATGRDLVVKHLLDSLAGFRFLEKLPQRSSIADVGSGAGFPGIPLSLFLPDSQFFLIERSEKRAGFLEGVVALLRLSNVRVIPSELRTVRERFGVVVLRAFSPLPREWGNLLAVTQEDGVIAAYKGRVPLIRREIALLQRRESAVKDGRGPVKGSGVGVFPDVEILPLHVPFLNGERHLVLFHRKGQP